MNNEQRELLDEVYENYLQHYDDEYNEEQKKIQKNPLHWMEMRYTNIRPYPKEMFINKCKIDPEFSEKWGLKIEERELSLEERCNAYLKWYNDPKCVEWKNHIEKEMGWNYEKPKWVFNEVKEQLDEAQFPTKLITITYNNKTIESYE